MIGSESVSHPQIAIIEDDSQMREMLVDFLADDYKVVSYGEPISFLNNILQIEGQLALVISDIDMPEMSGLELLKVLKERSENLAVLMISASAKVADQRQALHLGADAFLKKPFRMRDFKEEVNKLIQLRQSDCLLGSLSTKQVLA